MFEPTDLPEDLKQRLLAAGVQDAESLSAALEADADLRNRYEQWLVSVILQRFAATQDRQALQTLVAEVPFLLEDAMIEAIRAAVAQAEARGDTTNAEALRQRLSALLDIKEAQRQAQLRVPLGKALTAFIQAGDDLTASAVFWQHRHLLATDDAEAFLINQFESADSKARLHLERRRHLLRALRERWQAMEEEDAE